MSQGLQLMSNDFIQWKNGNAYFRRKVPHDIVEVVGAKEWSKALKTGDKRLARERADALKVQTDQEIARAYRTLSGEKLTLQETEQVGAVHFEHERHYGALQLKRAAKLDSWLPGDRPPASTAATWDALLEDLSPAKPDLSFLDESRRAQLRSLEDCQLRGDYQLVYPFADQAFLDKGLALEVNGELEIDRTRDDYQALARELLQRQIAAVKEGLLELWRSSIGTPEPPPRQLVVQTAKPEEASELREEAGKRPLELFPAFKRDSEGRRGRSMLTTVETALRLLEEVTGSKGVAEIARKDVAVFHDLVSECPAKHRARLKTKTMREAIEKNKARPSPFPGNSRATVAKHLSALNSFFKWAVSRHYAILNPAAGVVVEGGHRNGTRRESFTADELKALFALKPFQAPLEARDHRFWVPYLALYTGARLAELCQLEVTDIRQRDGLAWIEINGTGEEKSVKSAAARRIVPLHADLLALGFLAYWRARKTAGDSKLFPKAPRGAEGRNPYNPVSQWFTRTLEAAGIRRTGLSFHSFRHTWNETARQCSIPRDMREALLGHENGSVNDDYGGTFGLEARAKAVGMMKIEVASDASRDGATPPPVPEAFSTPRIQQPPES